MQNTLCACTHLTTAHKHGTHECQVPECGCQYVITDPEEWKLAKERWDWEDAEDERCWTEVYAQQDAERQDSEYPSGSTDLGNKGGTTFNY